MTKRIEVKILQHNLDGTPRFLAALTQRGHILNSMEDICDLYESRITEAPSEDLMNLPHTTLVRMNYITVAISGLSTKAVSQLRTHATRLTFMSTSTQYSSYDKREHNYVMPDGLNVENQRRLKDAYRYIHAMYSALIEDGVDKDKVGYLLPQGLRKSLIISGHLDAWRYVISTRMCHRNTEEVQLIMRLLYKEIEKINPIYTIGMKPQCYYGNCPEGKFTCGQIFTDTELE